MSVINIVALYKLDYIAVQYLTEYFKLIVDVVFLSRYNIPIFFSLSIIYVTTTIIKTIWLTLYTHFLYVCHSR